MKAHRSILVAAALVTIATAGLAQDPTGERPTPACGTTACANPWDCWTVTVVYRELLTLPDQNLPPVYRVRQVEFLHEPDNAWQFREDAECHARKAVLEGIMRPLNFPQNDQRDFIPPSVIERVRIWKIPMPDF
jgi:hypothetical protein